jgi:hypothetical protein
VSRMWHRGRGRGSRGQGKEASDQGAHGTSQGTPDRDGEQGEQGEGVACILID